ncbi:MAG: fumarylacetoacetate hydrolase family protein [Candidatus Kariarchaeaceae archaeon]|jgi:2-keto-4-pentenoate hydratase/2-oxohepta-3-ene-1,7-dioic acid hydratase in catechol pathway
MRLATVSHGSVPKVALVIDNRVLLLEEVIDTYQLPSSWNVDMKTLISNYLEELVIWYNSNDTELSRVKGSDFESMTFLPLYPDPDKIWGIGLNYAGHAADLDEGTPDKYPGSFMRPTTTIIGHEDTIQLSELSQRTTGEGELGIIIGKKCKNVDRDQWLSVVAGFTTIIDCTAEDILRLNPRFLTLSKSFDSFFSFGPVLITADEFTTDKVMHLEVSTLHKGKVYASNVVSNMQYPPDFLVEFHSQVMTLLPGDIISTGTPRAVQIEKDDTVGARISGFYDLKNRVTR